MPRRSRPRLIGRDDVLTGLTGALARSAEGHGQVVVITGPAGIGKSRLVAETLLRARGAGMGSATGHCDSVERSLPFAPLVELLRRAPHPPSDAPAELAIILPELGQASFGPAPDGASLVRSVARAVVSVARPPGLVAAIEDLHWCDDSSALALAALVRLAADAPLLLLLTLRPDEAAPELSTLLAAIDRAPHAQEWRLVPLSVSETAELAAEVAGSSALPPPRFAERLHLITDGNPLFIEEVVAAVVTDEGFPDPSHVDRVSVPRSVQAAVWQRGRSLSPPARRLLQLAAVAGREADVDLLAEIAGLDEDTLVEQLRELFASGLVLDQSADTIAFAHELTRRAVLADLLARERRSLHLLMAEALARRTGGTEVAAGELARHFWEGEDWERAAAYAVAAGHHALRLGAPGTAVELFGTALDAGERAGLPADPDVLAARAGAYERAGEFALAKSDLERRWAIVRAERRPDRQCAALLDLGSLWTARDYGVAGDFFRRALDVARTAPDPGVLPVALNRVGSWHLNSDRPDQARRLHEEALALYARVADEAGAATSYDLLGTVELTVGNLAAAAAAYREAAARLREGDDLVGLASALAMQAFAAPQYLSWTASWSGALGLDGALASARESVELCRSMAWASAEAVGHIAQASVLGEHGRYGEALEHGEQARRLADESGHTYWLLLAHLVLGALHLDILDPAAARRHTAEAAGIAGAIGSDYWVRTASGFVVDASLLDGDRAAARAGADAGVDGETGPGAPRLLTMGMRHLWRGRAELALADGQGAAAVLVTEAMREAAARAGPPGPRVELLHGRALAACGRAVEAEEIWRGALAEAEARELAPVAWRLHAALGRAARRARRLDDADHHLGAARRLVATLAGDVPEGPARDGFVARALAGMPQPTARRAAKARYGGLTAREQDVARLIADGLTNGEIAEHLVLSRRTVEKHVEHVLTKLGLATRAHIAAWAVRAGLAGQEMRDEPTRSA